MFISIFSLIRIDIHIISTIYYISLPKLLFCHYCQVFPERQGKWKATAQSREFLKSIKRYYSNTYTDGEKQDAINL